MKYEIEYRDERPPTKGNAETYVKFVEQNKTKLSGAKLAFADLTRADLSNANLTRADLTGADLSEANLADSNLTRAKLTGADMTNANLTGVIGMVKIMGVEHGNIYWKRFNKGLENEDYKFFIGINRLSDGEVFADDERIMCSYPGFYFASRSWCAINHPDRKLEAKIRIPDGAKINEPWATDGKASADMIEILQVFDVETGEDVTKHYIRKD